MSFVAALALLCPFDPTIDSHSDKIAYHAKRIMRIFTLPFMLPSIVFINWLHLRNAPNVSFQAPSIND
jgi:signal recognition particle receptor subunit beta